MDDSLTSVGKGSPRRGKSGSTGRRGDGYRSPVRGGGATPGSAAPHARMPFTTVPVDVGQAEVAAAVAVRQLLVVEAHQVQDRRVQVVDVDAVLDRVEAELVGRAVDHARP